MAQQASHIEQSLDAEVGALRSLPAPNIAEQVDIYDEAAKEVLVMSDAIGVKAQRPTRECRTKPRPEKKLKRISTDLMLIEGREGSFLITSLCAGLDESATLKELAQAHLKKEWGNYPEPLPIVAITDGARSIRLMLERLFGGAGYGDPGVVPPLQEGLRVTLYGGALLFRARAPTTATA